MEEEASRQENIEEITRKAIPLLDKDSDPSVIEDDWITNFFDKSRIISNNEMQELWAQVLAGEANSPGDYSKRTVNYLCDMDKYDAEIFSALCKFVWFLNDKGYPLIFDETHEIYTNNGVDFGTITQLESIGLIRISELGFRASVAPGLLKPIYFENHLSLTMNKEEHNFISVGKVLFTKAGHELSRICISTKADGFFAYVKDKWKENLPES